MNPRSRDYVMGLAFFALAFTLLTFARCTQAAILGPLSSAQKAMICSCGGMTATRSAKTASAATVGVRKASGTQHSAKQPYLTYAQKQIMVEAYQAGYHVGLPLAFTAVVYVESQFRCRVGDHGLAHSCAQLHPVAVRAATGMNIPTWRYSLASDEDVGLAIGAQYLAHCVQRWGWPAGIGAYNTGPTMAAKLGRKRLTELPYTRAVLAAMVWLREVPISDD